MNPTAKMTRWIPLAVSFGLVFTLFARDNNGERYDPTLKRQSISASSFRQQYALPADINTIEEKMRYRQRKTDRSVEYTAAEVERQNRKDKLQESTLAIPLFFGDNQDNVLAVPGGGDIFPVYHASFDSAALFDEWTKYSLDTNTVDWFAFDLYDELYGSPVYVIYNSVIAPTPGPNGDFNANADYGHPDAIEPGPKDYVAEIWVPVPDLDTTGNTYKVADVGLDIWLENDDPNDFLSFEFQEPAKWHLDGGEWAMTSNQYSVPGYGNAWREDLMTPMIDLSAATGTVTLSFDHTYDMESTYWDGGNIWARIHVDSAWTLLTPTG
ncbi:MAG: hypothetical protein KAU50_09740, partial [Candidatus Marinimicrobia bacterium]|nr:hypothetical protein [Candidatus Neomarinimicrobiota bacterium]